ncbi:CTP-dependent riboflavin kinase [Candidatus Micrarchaeota archaeon]|nr:CTP-dependent riboflavin kinase [Candidatus Micrarchaeota archaeon]MBU1166361.1 CTP-dependent riboflavin kinase [Candidatus Micrarchaeota archaeon]MBU1886488.1 CTP-dependent riboflavin kinase [Candidatus Micrarchaeota archaeon]
MEIQGTITDGLGKGKCYLSLDGYRRQIKEKFGFEPYPGTLNLKISDPIKVRKYLEQKKYMTINGFCETGPDGKGMTYGELHAYLCEVDGTPCAIIIPLKTSHEKDTIEIISKENLREKTGKTTNDILRLRI